MIGMTCASGFNPVSNRLWHFVPKPVSYRMDALGLVASLISNGKYDLLKIGTTSANYRDFEFTLTASKNFVFALITGTLGYIDSPSSVTNLCILVAPNTDTTYCGIPTSSTGYIMLSSTATSVTLDKAKLESDNSAAGGIITVALFG